MVLRIGHCSHVSNLLSQDESNIVLAHRHLLWFTQHGTQCGQSLLTACCTDRQLEKESCNPLSLTFYVRHHKTSKERVRSLEELLQLSALLSVEQVAATTEVLLVDKDVRNRPLTGLFHQISLVSTVEKQSIPHSLTSAFPLRYKDMRLIGKNEWGTYLNVAALGAHGVQLEDADLGLVQVEFVDHRLCLRAIGAVALGKDSDEMLRDELLCSLLGGHLAVLIQRSPVDSGGRKKV